MTLWTAAHQVPLSMKFSRQDYQSRLQFPSLGDLPDPGIVPGSPVFAGGFFTAKPSGTPIGEKKKKIGDPSPPAVLETLIFLFCPDFEMNLSSLL